MHRKKEFSQRSKRDREHILQSMAALYGDGEVPEVRSPKLKTPRSYPERDLVHRPLVRWFRLQYPKLAKYLRHFPNERKCTPMQGAMLKQLGVTAGTSDLFLAVTNDRYCGFWIELKAPGKKPSEAQYEFLRDMREQRYCADWYDDWEKAKDAILEYLS